MKHLSKIFPVLLAVLFTLEASSQAPGWFTKNNSALGWPVTTGAQVLSITDVNNDDYPDIITVFLSPGETIYTVRKPIRIYLNIQDPQNASPGARKFIDITSQTMVNIVPPDTGNNANCFTLADFNNDGNVDLVTGNYYHRIETYTNPNDRCQIYLGDGTGNFTWLPANGLASLNLINVRAISALDYDRDGNLDLFIAAWFKNYTNNVWDHGYLMKGNGDGTFTDVTDASGIGGYLEPMYGSAATDWNNDCYPDIFTAPYCRTGGKVFKNDGTGHFSNVSDAVGYNLLRQGNGQPACTFGIIPEDVNNDGNMDVFLNVVHGGNGAGEFRSTIAINKGAADNYGFDIQTNLLPTAAPASTHRGDYDGVFMDFDNDGLKDLIMVQGTYGPSTDRTYFWKQQADHSFQDATPALGLLVTDLKNSAAIEAFDYDLDGDDDFAIIGAGAYYCDIWRNNIGSEKNWISVKLNPHAGSGINKNAIGARIYVHYQGKMQMREVMAGRGQHTGQQPFILNFGLGDATSVDSIVIRWPDINCTRKTIYNPPVNGRSVINSFPTGMAEQVELPHELKCFPNPTAQYLVVQGDRIVGRTVSAVVLDISGRVLEVPYSKSDGDKLVFDMERLADGVYFIHLDTGTGKPEIRQVIKRR